MSLSNFILDLEPLEGSDGRIHDDNHDTPIGDYIPYGEQVVVALSDGKPVMAVNPQHDNEVEGWVDQLSRNRVIDMVVVGDHVSTDEHGHLLDNIVVEYND